MNHHISLIILIVLTLLSSCQSEVQDGVYEELYSNGAVKIRGAMHEGKKDGEWKYWHQNGQIQRIENYKDDTLDGRSISWYENGNQNAEAFYKNGKLINTYKQYFSNGRLNFIHNFDSIGRSSGIVQVYTEDGTPIQSGRMDKGKMVGVWMEYDENNKLVEINYDSLE